MPNLALDAIIEVSSNVLLFLLIFGMSATVNYNNIIKQLKNKYAICIGIFMQFFIMPTLGYVALKFLGNERISPTMGIILLIVTSSPGGSYSNWWCSLFNADLALSVTMTALSTIFSTFLLPANLLLFAHATYGRDQDSILNSIDWGALFISLTIVIVAILLGLMTSSIFKTNQFRRWANRFGSMSGLALVIFSALMNIWTENDEDGSSNRIWNQNWAFYVGVSFPCIFGLIIANVLSFAARLSPPERVTLSIECCYQNVGIATSVAVSMFDDKQQRAEALGVPLLYGFVEAFILAVYCVFAWRKGWTKAPKDEKMWKMLVNTYEVVGDDCSTSGTLYTEDDELNDAMNGTPIISMVEELKDIEFSSNSEKKQKRCGDSVDTTNTASSTASTPTSITTQIVEFESIPIEDVRPGELGTFDFSCKSPRISRIQPFTGTPCSARRRSSPFISCKKKIDLEKPNCNLDLHNISNFDK